MTSPKRNWLQYLISFLFDSLIEKRSSSYNEELSVRYYEGRYMLDSKTSNFSFGTLHRVFELAFNKLKIHLHPVDSALILGYGAGSVAELLNQRFSAVAITGVEIDAEVIAIAEEYFELNEQVNSVIIEGDAGEFVRECNSKFDLVAIDLFDDNIVPEQFQSIGFLEGLKLLVAPNGILVFNAAINDSKQDIGSLAALFMEVFPEGDSMTIDANEVLAWRRPIAP